MRYILLFAVSILFATTIKAQTIEIKLDLENAKETIRLLEKKKLTEKELEDFVNLPGTKAIIRKVNSTADTAKSALRKAIAKQTLSPQESYRFQYDAIYENLPFIKKFITELDGKEDSIISVLKAEFQPLIPADKTMKVTVYGLLGSFSGGWASGDDPGAFYMGLHFKPNDVNGVINTSKHELFHNLQSLMYTEGNTVYKQLKKANEGYGLAYGICYYLYKEGTAEYIADVKKASLKSAAAKKSYDHMVVNVKRASETFYLFERLTYDLYINPEKADYNKTYSTLFDWNWNNPAYYVGLVMTQALVKEKGEDYLKNSLSKDPLYFIKDYIELSKTKKQEVPYQFSDDFEKLIDNMMAVK